MEIKTLDERIRERGKSDWANRVRSVAAGVNSLASGDLRNQRMEIKTTAQDGKRLVADLRQLATAAFGKEPT